MVVVIVRWCWLFVVDGVFGHCCCWCCWLLLLTVFVVVGLCSGRLFLCVLSLFCMLRLLMMLAVVACVGRCCSSLSFVAPFGNANCCCVGCCSLSLVLFVDYCWLVVAVVRRGFWL